MLVVESDLELGARHRRAALRPAAAGRVAVPLEHARSIRELLDRALEIVVCELHPAALVTALAVVKGAERRPAGGALVRVIAVRRHQTRIPGAGNFAHSSLTSPAILACSAASAGAATTASIH